jgi:transcriptional regulator with XRE-family HTH domain
MAEPHYIGSMLRHARKVKGLRLIDVASEVGCTEGFLSRVENNKANPSFQLLVSIARALDVKIGHLADAPSEPGGIVTRAGEQVSMEVLSKDNSCSETLVHLTPKEQARLLFGTLHIIQPQGGSAGTYSHEGEEVGYVIEGEFELTVDGKRYLLKSGDSFFFHSKLKHSYINPTDKPTRVVWVSSPI